MHSSNTEALSVHAPDQIAPPTPETAAIEQSDLAPADGPYFGVRLPEDASTEMTPAEVKRLTLLAVGEDKEVGGAAFAQLFESYKKAIASVVLTRLIATGAQEDIEDILQTTAAKGFAGLEKLEYRRDLFSWLCAIATNAKIDLHRYNNSRPVAELSLSANPDHPAVSRVLTPDNPEAIALTRVSAQEALALPRISPEQRDAITCVTMGGMTVVEYARTNALPLGTVKSRIFNGLNTMRRHMRERP